VTRLPAAGGKVVAPFSNSFDCRTKEVWSADKAKWCADHPSWRTLLPDATTRSPPPPSPPPPPVEQAKHPDGDFNCRSKEVWSTEKLQWCIDHASNEPGQPAVLPPPPVAQGTHDHPMSAEAPTIVIGNPAPAALVSKPAVVTAQPPAARAQLQALPEIIVAQLLEAGLSASECSGLAGEEDPAVCRSTHALCSDAKWGFACPITCNRCKTRS
jgi:hypothetical protein